MKRNMRIKNFKGGQRNFWVMLFVSVLTLGLLTKITDYARSTHFLSYSDFLDYVEQDKIRSVRIDGQEVQGTLKHGSRFETVVADTPALWDLLRKHHVDFSCSSPSAYGNLWYLGLLALFGALGAILWFTFRQTRGNGGGGVFAIGKVRVKVCMPSEIKVTFDSVAGAAEAKESLKDVVSYLKNPDRFQRLGAKLPRGVLLVGEPGNGKTLLAKALAGEANRPFLSVSGSDFIEVFVGVGAARIRDLFAQARKHGPSIIFIDEIDAVGRRRGAGYGGSNDEREQTLNQLLIEMDGFDSSQVPVVVIAATNIPEVLDKALLRPGRFDRRVMIPFPDRASREHILRIHARDVVTDGGIDFSELAELTAGFSGADLANLMNQATLFAARQGRDMVLHADCVAAHEEILKARRSEAVDMAHGEEGSQGRSRAVLCMPSQIKTKFSDVAGALEAKEDLEEIVDFLKTPEKYARLGARVPRGVLLTGDPGNGKTLLARAVAGESGRPFFSIAGSDFVEKYVGVGAARVRELFVQARRHAPCIIFIDEIDSVGRRRGGDESGGEREHSQTLNQLLTEMDGFSANSEPIVIIGATNRFDILDSALTRPGRFDRHVLVPYPDIESRELILRVHARSVTVDEKVDFKKIARGTPHFTGADLAKLVNEAAIFASKEGRPAVIVDDFNEARDRQIMGKEMRSIKMSPEELRMTAFHEAGHTVVQLMLPPEDTDPLFKVTIIPRGMSLGAMHSLPERDKYAQSREEMIADITCSLGGRAAEVLVFNKVSTGAQSDFMQATNVARSMICRYGMSDRLGHVVYQRGGAYEYSQETAAQIDQEVRALIELCYQRALEILKEHRAKLDALALELLDKEILYAPAVYELLGLPSRESHALH